MSSCQSVCARSACLAAASVTVSAHATESHAGGDVAGQPLVASNKESEVVGVCLAARDQLRRRRLIRRSQRRAWRPGEAGDAVDHDGPPVRRAGPRRRRHDHRTLCENVEPHLVAVLCERGAERPQARGCPRGARRRRDRAPRRSCPARRRGSEARRLRASRPDSGGARRGKATSCAPSLRGSADPTATTRRNRCRK